MGIDDEIQRDLKRRCRETFGTGLRLAFWYSLNGGVEYGMIRFRRDIKERYANADEARVVATNIVADMRENEPEVTPDQLHDIGELQATAQVFRDAVIIHATHEHMGLVVSYDAEQDADLVEFTRLCNEWLREAAEAQLDH
jgi:hypothetical protein